MRISFCPQRRDDTLTLEKMGDRLRINGDLFNFNAIPDGGTIPDGEVPSPWIIGPIDRIDGEIHLTLILPHGPNPSATLAFPEPIAVTEDGPIALPSDLQQEEPADVEP